MTVDYVVKACLISVGDSELVTNPILLDIREFNVILGIDWLTAYHAILDCFKKRVIFQIPGQQEFNFLGDQTTSSVFSAIQVDQLRK